MPSNGARLEAEQYEFYALEEGMDVLERLIAESRKLEKTASRIQDGTRLGLSPEEIEAFVLAYRHWYAECLSVLAPRQQYSLRKEYEGSEYRPRIREFLLDPTDLWEPGLQDVLLNQVLSGAGKFGLRSSVMGSPAPPHWRYPYRETFYPYLLNQRQTLLEATKQQKGNHQTRESWEAEEFDARGLPPEVREHTRSLFLDGNYEDTIFAGYKAFEKCVQKKAHSNLSGYRLMKQVLDSQRGPLRFDQQRVENQQHENEQEGLKLLCMGLVRAIRNPRAHELAQDRPVTREDALDILSFISLLYRQIEMMSYIGRA
jgi:uncharacterized protein (TIGR02391 family)